MLQLIARSTRLVVMTERGRNDLGRRFTTAPPAKIDLIPHGIFPTVTICRPD